MEEWNGTPSLKLRWMKNDGRLEWKAWVVR